MKYYCKFIYCTILFLISSIVLTGQELSETQLRALKSDDTVLFKKEFAPGQYDQCFTIKKESMYSPLLISIKMDRPHIFAFLLEQKGIDLNKMCEDKTPLMYAAKYGKEAFASMLLEKGADRNIVNPEGKTARDYAENYKNYTVYDLLSRTGKEGLSGSEGPVIINENGKLVKYQIRPYGNGFLPVKEEIKKGEALQCFVTETNDSFIFRLKEKLSVPPAAYVLPDNMLIISDIEGNFKGFKSILLGNNVIDKNLNWAFGDNHLVLLGDFFDRGLNVTECLWLIYKLENEAEKQGGKVHFILGNHEMMNLKGQWQYVRSKYKENADTLHLDYARWYTNESELGKWLRTKNSIEKIGDFLFVHAGISKDLPEEYSIEAINEHTRNSIDKEYERKDDFFLGSRSVLWYRGIATEKESQQELEATLSRFHAEKMIIGHTILGEIKYLYNKKVIAIDLDHKENEKKGKMYALWIEKGKLYITDSNGDRKELK